MGGNAFRVPCIISSNGISVSNLSVLPDSGANGFAFLDTTCAIRIAKLLQVKARRLPTPIHPRGYGGIPGDPITHFICFDLVIDSRTLRNVPFLILDLSNVDIILGWGWLKYFNVSINAGQEKLTWPRSLPRDFHRSWAKQIMVDYDELTPRPINKEHQRDMHRRNDALIKEDKRRLAGTRSRPVSAVLEVNHKAAPRVRFAKDVDDIDLLSSLPQKTGLTFNSRRTSEIQKMNNNLQRAELPDRKAEETLTRRSRRHDYASAAKSTSSLDISMISAVAMHLNMRRRDNELFVSSIDEIDRELSSRNQVPVTEKEELMARLPNEYHEFVDVFSKTASDVLPPHRSYDHKIEVEPGKEHGYGPLYSQSNEELMEVKKYLVENLDKGFIEPSQAPYSSPVLFVKKPNGSLRFCVDYRKLNAITKKDRYPLPLIDETLARLSRAKIYTKLDIRQAFHRIRMHPDSEALTTFRCRYGAYKCKVLPFGLTNGPATYQRYMNDILMDFLDVFCTAYLDDILIFSENELEHEMHVKKVLERLRKAGLQADINKCEFGVKSTKYLGFIVSTDGIRVDPEKVEAVQNWEAPRTVKGVQSFLGFCNFYRRFIPAYGRVARPLTNLTHLNVPWNYTNECNDAFEELKKYLTTSPTLAHYDFNKPSRVETDASEGVIAGILSQPDDVGFYRPIGFFSKTMLPAEINYEIHDKEMLAIVRAFNHWRPEFQGTPKAIEVFTDHKALEVFMTTKQLNGRQARWAETLAAYNFEIAYRPGVRNQLADALSRREQDEPGLKSLKKQIRLKPLLKPENLSEALRARLEEDKLESSICLMESNLLIDDILKANRSHRSLRKLRKLCVEGHPQLSFEEDDLLLFKGRLIVAKEEPLRTKLIEEAHASLTSAHCSARKTQQMLKERYYWHGMQKDVERYVRNCQICGRNKIRRDKVPGLLHPLPAADRPWQHICCDFKTQPPDDKGFDNACIFIDRFLKKSISIPCHKTATAADMAEIYYVHVYRHHDFPDSIVSDRGPQFISFFWDSLTKIVGVKLALSTAYSPQTDGQTEIMNEYNDQRLRPFVNHFQTNWSDLLPALDNAQLTLPHTSLGGLSPFFVAHGHSPRKSFDWKAPKKPENAKEKLALEAAEAFAKRLETGYEFAKAHIIKAQDQMIKSANQHRREPDWKVKDMVYLSTKNLHTDRPSQKLSAKYAGPFEVLEQKNFSYKLDIPKSWKIYPVFHARYLRKYDNNPHPSQVNSEPEPINVTGEDEWTVESLRTVKKGRGGILQYRANWLGCDEDPEFYPASNFKYSPHLLRNFHIQHPELPGPPLQLQDWIDAFEKGEEDYEHLGNNKPMPSEMREAFFTRCKK